VAVLGDFADGHVIEVDGSEECGAEHKDLDAVDRRGEPDRELPPITQCLDERELGYHLVGAGVEDSDSARPGKRGERGSER
jgi:hypothetical protein